MELLLHSTNKSTGIICGHFLSTRDPEFEAQLEVAREVMRKRRAVLRELAK
jgi:hypothetical protein